MVIAAWHMLSTGETYQDLGGDYFDRRTDPEPQARRLSRQLQQLGFDVTLTPAA
jgi:transposase